MTQAWNRTRSKPTPEGPEVPKFFTALLSRSLQLLFPSFQGLSDLEKILYASYWARAPIHSPFVITVALTRTFGPAGPGLSWRGKGHWCRNVRARPPHRGVRNKYPHQKWCPTGAIKSCVVDKVNPKDTSNIRITSSRVRCVSRIASGHFFVFVFFAPLLSFSSAWK